MEAYFKSIKNKNDLGMEIKADVYKVRVANSSKNRGKSAGYRLLTYFTLIKNKLHLLYIYDKGLIGNLTETEVDNMISSAFNIDEK